MNDVVRVLKTLIRFLVVYAIVFLAPAFAYGFVGGFLDTSIEEPAFFQTFAWLGACVALTLGILPFIPLLKPADL